MSASNKGDELLSYIRQGRAMTRAEKLRLIAQLSVPSILSQMSATVMFFIDASMVGHIGAEASASIGLVETTTWLLGSITNAASLGFSVQAAHFIGSGDFGKARQVFRHGLVCTTIISMVVLLLAVAVHSRLPYWLGGGEDIARDASLYFLIFSLAVPSFQLSNLCGAMLKCSGNMRIPSIVSVLMCVLDVIFNYIFIFVMGLGVVGAAIGTALAVTVAASLQA